MIELNLLPDVKKEFIKAQRTRNAVISGSILATIGAGIVIAVLATTVYIGQQAVIAVQTDSIKKKENELKSKPEIDKYLTVQNQLKHIDELHNSKYTYSRAFTYLQQLNPAQPNNVALRTVKLNKEVNTLEITGTARNFEALSVYKTTLENAELKYKAIGSEEQSSTKLFDSIVLTQASLANVDNKVLTNFEFTLTYPEAAFATSSKDISISIPSLVTSDADRNAPKQVFGTQPEETQ